MILSLPPNLSLMGFPVEIGDELKYQRKSFEFNFGMIVGEQVPKQVNLRVMIE